MYFAPSFSDPLLCAYTPTPLHPIIPDTSLYTVPCRAARSSANQWPDQQWTMTSALVVPLKLFVFIPSALDDGTIVWTGMFQGPSRDEACSFISPFYGVCNLRTIHVVWKRVIIFLFVWINTQSLMHNHQSNIFIEVCCFSFNLCND